MLEVDRFRQSIEELGRAFEERARAFQSMDARDRLAELTRHRNRILGRMQKRFRRIHRDFRSCAEESLTCLQARMDAVLAQPLGGGPAEG